MDQHSTGNSSLIKAIIRKGTLKQEIYQKTLGIFNEFKTEARKLIDVNADTVRQAKYPLLFEFSNHSPFEFQLKFGSDILIFFMHTNIFELPRDHEVMKTPYIREDKSRSYGGLIHIFNFLADSFKYNRVNDLGYLIGRVFVNRELHYFIEGKREVGLLYNNFSTAKLDHKMILSILHSAILYTINFDLLTPPFDNLKEVTVQEMQTTLDAMSIRTGKRLGFRFQADQVEE
ncbi:MAG: hypothetical protein WCO93_07520 [bacterium]